MPRDIGLRLTLPMRQLGKRDLVRLPGLIALSTSMEKIYMAALEIHGRKDVKSLEKTAGYSTGKIVIFLYRLMGTTAKDSNATPLFSRIRHLSHVVPIEEPMEWPRVTSYVVGSFPRKRRTFANMVFLGEKLPLPYKLCRWLRKGDRLDWTTGGRAAFALQCPGMDSLTISCGVNDTNTRSFCVIQKHKPDSTHPWDTASNPSADASLRSDDKPWQTVMRTYGPICQVQDSLDDEWDVIVLLKCAEGIIEDTITLHMKIKRRNPEDATGRIALERFNAKRVEVLSQAKFLYRLQDE
jgi:hypothetical protein